MILADTSAWGEFDRATGSAVHLRLREAMRVEGLVAVTELVIMEVTAGARSAHREAELRRLLQGFPLLTVQTPTDFDGATRIYRQCRQAGVTPRGLIDCMIAAVAWRNGASLLSTDADLARVADVVGIELDDASLAG